MDDDIKLIKKQNTEEAKYFFNTNAVAYQLLKRAVVDKKGGNWLMDQCVRLANANDEFFGSLYVAELDAVQWDSIIDEEAQYVAKPRRK